MHWQDWVLTIGQVIFIFALVPTVVHKHNKPALSTSMINGIVLIVFAGVYISFSLWFAAVTAFLTGMMRFILAIQAFILGNKKQS